MSKILLLLLLCTAFYAAGQSDRISADSLWKINTQNDLAAKKASGSDTGKVLNSEDDIKAQLILLALNNSQVVAADANVRIAEIARKKANSSFLSSVSVGGNINEFVINNSPAASFFPKYNFGITVPFDVFAKAKAEKRTTEELITVNKSQKILIGEALKAKVLMQYENYKEKKELLLLQRIILDDEAAAYEKAQRDYKDEAITIDEMNKVYREMIGAKASLTTKEKELNIAIIEIEQTIGVPLTTVLEKRTQ
jgi:outer membrane protein TolC